MRTIKFRGYNALNKQWLIGFYLQNRKEHFVCPDEFANGKSWEDYQVEPESIGQFTGLYDKNGKEVYEGDIVEWENLMETKIHSQIIYDERKFSFGDVNGDSEDIWCINFEVIGNIHDTPELMKGE